MTLAYVSSPVACRRSRRALRCASHGAVGLALVLAASWASARSDSAAPPSAPVAAPASAVGEGGRAEAAAARTRVRVQPRETLDAVIRRTHRGSPFRDEVLRRAFVQLNPAAFEGGSPHALLAGAELLVPTVADVLAHAGIALPRPPEAETRPSRDSAEEVRQWVRYP